jgi:hypothetical protein
MNNEIDYLNNDIVYFENLLKKTEENLNLSKELKLNKQIELAEKEIEKLKVIISALRMGYYLIYIDGFLESIDACGETYVKTTLSEHIEGTVLIHGKEEIIIPPEVLRKYKEGIQANLFNVFEIYSTFEPPENVGDEAVFSNHYLIGKSNDSSFLIDSWSD